MNFLKRPCWKNKVFLPCDKIYIEQCIYARLLPQHACGERGTAARTQTQKKWKRIPESCHMSKIEEKTCSQCCEILWKTAGEGSGMKGRGRDGGDYGRRHLSRTYLIRMKEKKIDREGKVTGGGKDTAVHWITVTQGLFFFFPPKWSDTACSPFSTRRPETVIICPINHIYHISVFFNLHLFIVLPGLCQRSVSVFSPRVPLLHIGAKNHKTVLYFVL